MSHAYFGQARLAAAALHHGSTRHARSRTSGGDRKPEIVNIKAAQDHKIGHASARFEIYSGIVVAMIPLTAAIDRDGRFSAIRYSAFRPRRWSSRRARFPASSMALSNRRPDCDRDPVGNTVGSARARQDKLIDAMVSQRLEQRQRAYDIVAIVLSGI